MYDCMNVLPRYIGGTKVKQCHIPLYPVEELREEIFALEEEKKKKLKNISQDQRRQMIRTKLSNEFVELQTKSINEIWNNNYFKSVLDSHIKKIPQVPFYITVYSKEPISNRVAYAISTSYCQRYNSYNPEPPEQDFLDYLIWCYPEIGSIETRIKLYAHRNNELIIVLDVKPEDVGVNPTVMKLTSFFNEEVGESRYKTVIKAYIDFDIIVHSDAKLSIEEVVDIANSHREATAFGASGEEGATYGEFLDVIKETMFKRKIKSYEYQYGSLAIELE